MSSNTWISVQHHSTSNWIMCVWIPFTINESYRPALVNYFFKKPKQPQQHKQMAVCMFFSKTDIAGLALSTNRSFYVQTPSSSNLTNTIGIKTPKYHMNPNTSNNNSNDVPMQTDSVLDNSQYSFNNIFSTSKNKRKTTSLIFTYLA